MTITETAAWPATEDEVTACRLAAAMLARSDRHDRWAAANADDSHMSALAAEAGLTWRALAGVLAVEDEQTANATARRLWRTLTLAT